MKNKNNQKPDEAVEKKSALRENIEAIIIAVILALFIRTFIIQAFKIPSGSMKDTLLIGDHLLVNKFSYGVRIPYLEDPIIPVSKPARGDIIVFRFPGDSGKDFIKRVVGVAGDTILIRDKKVYVNNRLLDPDWGVHKDPRIIPGRIQPRDNFGPEIVPKDCLFVMGDNRDHSYDSRFWGFVPLSEVRGKALIIYWSWNKDGEAGKWVRWGRIGQFIR